VRSRGCERSIRAKGSSAEAEIAAVDTVVGPVALVLDEESLVLPVEHVHDGLYRNPIDLLELAKFCNE